MTEFLWWLAQTAFMVAVLIPIVAVACRCLRRWPAMQHALWVIVLVKLLTPPVACWPWTARDLFPSPTSDDVAVATPDRHNDVDAGGKLTPTDAVPVSPSANNIVWSNPQRAHSDAKRRDPEQHNSSEKTFSWSLSGVRVLFGVWLLGGICTLFSQLRPVLFIRNLAAGNRPAPSDLRNEVEQIAGLLRMRAVPTRVSARISSPFVCCFGRPRLLWPESLTGDLEAYRSVIAHELAHVKRKDHWVGWLVTIAACVWWWNPLFWFLRRRLSELAEMSCDALALSVLPGERTQFAEAFLQLSQRVSETKTPAPALGAGTGKRKTFKRRLSMILNERVNAKLPKVGILAALLLGAVALPGIAISKKNITAATKEKKAKPNDGGLDTEKRGHGAASNKSHFYARGFAYRDGRLLDMWLVRIDPATGRWTKLVDQADKIVFRSRVSPDGATIAYTSESGTWTALAKTGGSPGKVSSRMGLPCWSADGKSIVISCPKPSPKNKQLVVEQWQLNESGDNHVPLELGSSTIVHNVSRDGKWFLTRRGSKIELISQKKHAKRLMAKKGGNPRFSPQGHAIVFDRQWEGEIVTVNLEGKSKQKVYAGDGNTMTVAPCWGPAGKQIAFLSMEIMVENGKKYVSADPTQSIPRITIVNLKSRKAREVKLKVINGVRFYPTELDDWK